MRYTGDTSRIGGFIDLVWSLFKKGLQLKISVAFLIKTILIINSLFIRT